MVNATESGVSVATPTTNVSANISAPASGGAVVSGSMKTNIAGFAIIVASAITLAL
jgi:hypothetical protein